MEVIRVWKEDGFELVLIDNYKQHPNGNSLLSYELIHNGITIFEGDEYCPSPLHCIDSDESVGGLLHFLSLRPGDTDVYYFDEYTEFQLSWVNAHGEQLSMYAIELCED